MKSIAWRFFQRMTFALASATISVSLSSSQKDVPRILPFTFPPKVKVGDTVIVSCGVTGSRDQWTYSWKKDGKLVTESELVRITNNEFATMLVFKYVSEESGGNYSCVANGPPGQDTYSAFLDVEAPPKWVTKPEDKSAIIFSSVLLPCVVRGTPEARIYWTKIKEAGEGDANLDEAMTVDRNGSLIVKSVTKENQGVYKCRASNGVGEDVSQTLRLSVKVPARFEEKFVVVTTRRGESGRLPCAALGDQPLTVTWKKERKQLSKMDSQRYEIFETLTPEGLSSELVVRSAERDDGALYTCTAENEFGKDERKIRVLVLEVPAPPLDVKVRETWTRSASVSWSAPYSGNSPITKYVVQYWRDQGAPHRLHELTVSSSQVSAMIKDLHPGTSYAIKVVAENEVGRGIPSDAVALHTGEEEPAAPPVDISVDAKGPSTIRVSWKAPPRDHWYGQLKGYYVGYRTRDSGQPYSYKSVEFEDAPQEYFLSNLARGTDYSVVVKAFNSAGSGPASHEAVARTLEGDLPPPPTVFVTSTTANSITIRWTTKHEVSTSGFTVHFREEGGHWQEMSLLKPEDSSYTLTGLTSGVLYQLYMTGTSGSARGDPSDVIAVKTDAGSEMSSGGVGMGPPGTMMNLDLSVIIPVAASLVATIVVVIVACLCVHKIRHRQHLERAIAEQQLAYKGTMQRYVDLEKARLSHPPLSPSREPLPSCEFPSAYNTLQMREIPDDTSSREDDPEGKAFLPQQLNSRDRPLPFPKPNSLKRSKEDPVYDMPQ